ncbi:MAG: hypothetical protein AMK72_07205 [Planctomycetes bacterium SM23_25]|nr:MAG: hypothetical protein AMK72_07205 [Planctomycetes bacterium SM23_25]
MVWLGTALWTMAACVPALGGEAGGLRQLDGEQLRATFGARGLVAIHDKALGRTVAFQGDRFALEVDEATIDSTTLDVRRIEQTGHTLVYHYQANGWPIEVVYELKPAWRFVSKHVRLRLPGKHRVKTATVLGADIKTPVVGEHRLRGGSYGAFLRFAGDAKDPQEAAFGLFAVIQNPFLKFDLKGGALSLAYEPDIDWSAEYGAFETDRVCLGTYALSGTRYPAGMLPEWHYVQNPEAYGRDGPQVDINETLALSECVRAFLTWRPAKSIRIHVDWCENAYQIDVSTAEGWKEYQRIIQRAADVGCDHILFTPHDETLAPLKENRDAWGWESLLWLNMGQKVRKGEWVPGKDALPAAVKQRLDFARERGIRLVAYAYPSLPFMQDPAWTRWIANKPPGTHKPGGYLGADTGERGFQDWLVRQLAAFIRQTGGGGFAFDHWWIAYEEASSKYAQWHGCRRILMEVRKQCPDIVMDGRQQYHWFGPWTWVAGSYPHPLATDEQPQSFRSFPDLHWSRGSADRQRYMGWWYRVQSLAPVEVMPGYMTHQTMRNDARGRMLRTRYRTRDFDYLGWKYSVISSIATAPVNHVVNYLPARDEAEYEHFSEADRRWLRDWLDWTDVHTETLRHLRPIIGQPMDRGFVFLFNPNYRRIDASFRLDDSIGLTAGKRFVFSQVYPDVDKERLVGHPTNGSWAFGETATLPMTGASALVLEVLPLPERLEYPVLLGTCGKVVLAASRLEVTGAEGEVGATQRLAVLLPDDRQIEAFTVNGKAVPFTQSGRAATATVQFAGKRFGKCEQIGQYDPTFKAGTFTGSFQIPKRVFDQLAARRKAWPIPYDEEELKATWTAPHRLLLFINIADPQDEMTASMTIDGRAVDVRKAYSCVYPQAAKRTFLGFCADLSSLEPDTTHKVKVSLPELRPGQFQGLFFDNIEPEFTHEIGQ